MTQYSKTSPSQITTFQRCEARWGFGSVLKLPQEQSPEAAFGEQVVHKQQEDYFLNGTLPTHPGNLIAITWAELAPPMTPGIQIERWLSGYKIGNIQVRGRVDYTDLRDRKAPLIIDWKSKGKRAFLKSEFELEQDIQLNIYAAETLQNVPEAESISVAHGYISRSVTQPWAELVKTAPIPKEQVQRTAESLAPTLDAMVSAATKPEKEWSRNEAACNDFNTRCPFYDRCWGSFESRLSQIESVELDEPVTKEEPAPMSSLQAKMQAAKQKAAEKAVEKTIVEPAAEKIFAVGITPPDAPRYDLTKSSTPPPTSAVTSASEHFYIIWNPAASVPPTTRFTTFKEAQDVAAKMSSRNNGQTYFVCLSIGAY